MIKTAMILAAGRGERMRPLTLATPKPLLEVGGEPLLARHLLSLARCGIVDVVINVWYLGQQIIDYIGDGRRYGVNVHFSVETELLDTGGGIKHALDLLGAQPFLVLSADIVTDFPYGELSTEFMGMAHLVLVNNPSYHPQGDFGLLDGMVTMHAASNFTYANIGVYRPEFFAMAPTGVFPLGGLLRRQVMAGAVSGRHFGGVWYNLGTPADLEVINCENNFW